MHKKMCIMHEFLCISIKSQAIKGGCEEEKVVQNKS